jgi:hypothetical protein
MSEIPFVNALGDAIELAIARESAAATRPRWWTRVPRRRGTRLVIVVAALGLAGGGYAATTQNSPLPQVADTINCERGTDVTTPARVVFENGRSPLALCAQMFRARGMRALAAPGALVGCARPDDSYIVVVKANGSPTECQHLRSVHHLRPLPLHAYNAAALRVQNLAAHLHAVQTSERCITPQALAQGVTHVLHQLHWTHWHAAFGFQQGRVGGKATPGPGGRTRSCGMYRSDGAAISDPIASLDQEHHTVWIFEAPPGWTPRTANQS